jgi:crotonobetainyl-CoA hydratase
VTEAADGQVPRAPDAVLIERRDTVLVLTINRARSLNAVDRRVADALGAALEAADRDDGVRVVIVTGAGGRAFCAGADIKAVARGEVGYAAGHDEWGFAGFVRHPIGKPVIAAVNGVALGGGAEIVLASDLAVAAESATIGLPEVTLGLFAAGGGAVRLPAAIPPKAAMEMLVTGQAVSARRAYETGLVNAVVPDAELMSASLALAGRIARNAPLAVQASKRVALGLDGGRIAREQTAWQLSDHELVTVGASADAAEGMRAFAEKRRPSWRAA